MSVRRHGFTLIELLVVVAIIALLISILLPSLKAAREQAKAVACGSNLRTIGSALRYYIDDNRAYYPGGHMQQGFRSYISWVPRIHKYLNEERKVWRCATLDQQGYFFEPYITTTRNDPKVAALGYDWYERPMQGDAVGGVPEIFSYGYNEGGVDWGGSVHLGLGVHIIHNNARDPASIEAAELPEKRIKNPANMYVIADSDADGTWDSWITTETGYPNSRPGDRHPGETTNVLLADGHQERIPFQRMLRLEWGERRRWNNDYEPHPERWR